jgi:starch phosphorylase
MDALFQRHLGADWMDHHDEPALWTRIDQVPDDALWATHLDLKRRLHRFLLMRSRRRLLDGRSSPHQVLASGALFDPETLTLGFARRFATYKRASLIFRDPGRLRALLCDPRRPIQIVFAGKAHPADEPGKHMLQEVYRAAEDRGFAGRIAFVEDYGLHAAQHLVQGVDVWLNTPRPPLEASGTSGEKAALNAVPSLSVLDGWWAEGYDGTNGWKIGSPDPGPDGDERDAADAADLYRCLEEEVVPAYYERNPDGSPERWLAIMRSTLKTLIPRFSARRMVKEYIDVLYRPGWEARGAAKAAADIPAAPRRT